MRELLNGVYDLHIHTSPDVVPRKYSDLELARRLGIFAYLLRLGIPVPLLKMYFKDTYFLPT